MVLMERTPWHSYGVSIAIWDHKWTHPALTPARHTQPVLDWPTTEGWKAELA